MIDWDRVTELQDEVGAEDFLEIVTLFLEEVDEATANLSPDLSGDALADALHFLKGCSLNLGFAELAALCARGEDSLRGGIDCVQVTDVLDSYRSSRDAFLSRVDLAA